MRLPDHQIHLQIRVGERAKDGRDRMGERAHDADPEHVADAVRVSAGARDGRFDEPAAVVQFVAQALADTGEHQSTGRAGCPDRRVRAGPAGLGQ